MKKDYKCPSCEMCFQDEALLELHTDNRHGAGHDIVVNEVGELQLSAKVDNRRASEIAASGIITATDFVGFMSAVMKELAEDTMTPQTGAAICNASSQLLKMVEMKYRYGRKRGT